MDKIDRWIDLGALPKHKGTDKIYWEKSINIPVYFKYENIEDYIIITKIDQDKNYIWVNVNSYTLYGDYRIHKNNFTHVRFKQLLTEKIITNNPELIKYFDNKEDAMLYSKSSGHRADLHCPLCGHKKQMRISDLYRYGFACPNCSDSYSYPSKFIRNLLMQLNIDFMQEVTRKNERFEWVGDYRYDFYFEIENRRIFIEADGHFHYGDYFQTYEEVHNTDLIKDILACDHNIEVIRIDCKYPNGHRFEYIKNNIINSELNSILNLDKSINWDACDKYAQSSVIKEICDLWNTGKYNLTDISQLLGLKPQSISRYLRDADRLGLCQYNVNEMRRNGLRKGQEKVKQAKSKPILLFKDGIAINVFTSGMELQRRSKELYGKTFQTGCIYGVCNGIYKQAYGYTMKYISYQEYEELLKQLNPTQN